MNLLLKDIAKNGIDGIGKPEPLRHREGWSRRVDDVNKIGCFADTLHEVELFGFRGRIVFSIFI
ncbi:MAG: type II toxin-antitoxin system YoeB family toxin [Oscillospiraceae bacterium]|nr:type II toxin-antitoxin system YoeB family toxin [Oscillospiraceae bacterium]